MTNYEYCKLTIEREGDDIFYIADDDEVSVDDSMKALFSEFDGSEAYCRFENGRLTGIYDSEDDVEDEDDYIPLAMAM